MEPVSVEPCLAQSIELEDPYQDVNISDVVSAWLLNPEQEWAFWIVASQSLNRGAESLRMFLTGPAGTGKSRVIDALKDYFEKRNQA